MAFQTGHWMNGLASVAKLICHDKVEGIQSGPNAYNEKNTVITYVITIEHFKVLHLSFFEDFCNQDNRCSILTIF